MEEDFRLAMTHEGMHALEVNISDIDRGLSLHPITKSNELSSCRDIPHVDKGGTVDHQPCSTNDMNSLKVTGVRQQMRG